MEHQEKNITAKKKKKKKKKRPGGEKHLMFSKLAVTSNRR